MKYLRRQRYFSADNGDAAGADDDPLSGVANLFDIGLVFIVALIVAVFSAYHMEDLFNQDSEMTIVKKSSDGRMEIISKKGRKIEILRSTPEQAKGQGERLGTAYRLKDGSVVYVPED
ncbi:MAG: DUF2149 domain-containing protein [Desulfuromonadales bacterium]|nr:DUF2149 domain-containing protein [Desulfuromonadales bacterium]